MATFTPVDHDPFAGSEQPDMVAYQPGRTTFISPPTGPKMVPVDHDPFASPTPSWSEVPGQAMRNVPTSAANLVGNIAHAVVHPINTAHALLDTGAGALRAGLKGILPEPVWHAYDALDRYMSSTGVDRADQSAGAVGSFIKDRYGSEEGFRRALATDPVGVLADASTVLTGAGGLAARAPGAAGQVGNLVARTGSAIDPLANAGRVVGRSGDAVADALGATTGAGSRPFREAFEAGRTNNQAFPEHMRGNAPIGDVVDMAGNAVNAMGRDRSATYNANMANVRGNQLSVDLRPVAIAINDAEASAYHMGIPINPAGAKVAGGIRELFDQFQKIGGPLTPNDFDALKRGIGNIRDGTMQGTPERRIADMAYNAVKSEITRQVPEYAAAMQDYGNASDRIAEMRRTMSVNDRAMPDTTLRKLQSTMRDGVNTNYGARGELLDELAQHEPDLPAALAGQSLNSWAPRGLARIGPMTVLAGGVHTMNPMTAALLPFQSPRLMGEATYAAGRATGATGSALNSVGATPQALASAAPTAYALGRFDASQNSPRFGLASPPPF